MSKSKESLKKIIDAKVAKLRTEKPKKTKTVADKVDGRAESSKLNAQRARETKLRKLAEKKEAEKEQKQNNIQEHLHPNSDQDESDDSDNEEIIIINPPPIDPGKQIKKDLLMKQQQEMYEWMQNKKVKKPKQNPVVINMSTPPKLSEEDEHLKRTLISKIQYPIIRF